MGLHVIQTYESYHRHAVSEPKRHYTREEYMSWLTHMLMPTERMPHLDIAMVTIFLRVAFSSGCNVAERMGIASIGNIYMSTDDVK